MGQEAMPSPRGFFTRRVLYPQPYAWFVLASALDIMMTWIVLHLGGWEVNSLAAWVIRNYDLTGVVLFKFACAILVIVICEVVGRRNRPLGAVVARWSVCLPMAAVVTAFYQLLMAR